MYLAIYNINGNHIVNIDAVTYSLTERCFDLSTFECEGIYSDNISGGTICVLCDEEGNSRYSCFVGEIVSNAGIVKIKGLDFRTLLDTEIYVNFPEYDISTFYDLLMQCWMKVFDSSDSACRVLMPNLASIPNVSLGNKLVLPTTPKIINVQSFLQGAMKLLDIVLETEYNVSAKKIAFKYKLVKDNIDIDLNDFDYTITTTSQTTNKTVALIQGVSTSALYYYRTSNNKIIQSSKTGNISNRILPVKTKIFEAEYLADSQFEAVFELANSLYVDNVVIDNGTELDPLDLGAFSLYTMVNLYRNGVFYKVLPIAEKTTTLNSKGKNVKVKLGFKKVLLTEIIKAK